MTAGLPDAVGPRRGASRLVREFVPTMAALAASVVFAYLLVGGTEPPPTWPGRGTFLAVAMLGAPVAIVVIHRYPLGTVAIWIAITQMLQINEAGSSGRLLYWGLHRALPLAVLAVIGISILLSVRDRPTPHLGWPEAMMAGYLVMSVLAIAHTSLDVPTFAYDLYDRMVVPMCLYLIVRLVEPDEDDVRRLLPVVVFVLLTQTLIGMLSWVAPGALPGLWLAREGLRTTGSLIHPNVYGVTMIIASAIILHLGMNDRWSLPRRLTTNALFVLGMAMVFMTYSRASWLAGLIVVMGLAVVYPRFIVRLWILIVVGTVLLISSGVMATQVETARTRFLSEDSEESALSRLPIVYASIKMFEARPLTGFGYGNFDRYDREYQARVGNLVAPEKDHASHNLYLTLLAEQGLLGFVLYMGPAVWWLFASFSAWRRLPPDGILSRRLLGVLWLCLLSHVVVNNFSDMRVQYGLGEWWLVLGMIAVIVHRATKPAAYLRAGDPTRLHKLLVIHRFRSRSARLVRP